MQEESRRAGDRRGNGTQKELVLLISSTLGKVHVASLEARKAATEQFLHTEKALLVDREGHLRGVYNTTLPHNIKKLIAELAQLLDRE